MSEIIRLKPTMQKRLNFKHELLDHVDDYKMSKEDTEPAVQKFLDSRSKEDRDVIIMGYLWLAKDVVCRYRSHWPEVRCMTDDLASQAMVSLTEFVDQLKVWSTQQGFFSKCQAYINDQLRDYINDNRSTFTASRETNARREASGEPTEYNFASEYSDELNGEQDFHPNYVDILDSVERLAEVDHEQMRDLISHFLEQDHNINEAELNNDEREALDKLSQIGRDLL